MPVKTAAVQSVVLLAVPFAVSSFLKTLCNYLIIIKILLYCLKNSNGLKKSIKDQDFMLSKMVKGRCRIG